ncbi:MAG: DUF4115 domain-containing protein [Desulfuromonadales bacterium]|nr:DUF4115 domain-containing protein [Desulfuromonadales bacterium]
MSKACAPENQAGNVDAVASSPGTILKRCREYHGTSIEEAAEATKIAVHHLMALENDQVKEFASLTYLKGFLRVYAGYLGLNPDDIMRLYERLDAPSGSPGIDNNNTSQGREHKRRRFPWQKLALPAVLLLLMIVTSVILSHSPAPSPSLSPPAPLVVAAPVTPIQPVRSSAGPVTAPQKPESESGSEKNSKHEEAVPEKNDPRDASPESGRGVIVRLKVVQNGSLAVSIDGSSAQNYDLASGDVFEWKADRHIALELSNAASVEAELNGKPLKPLNAPAYVVLDANGVKQ